MSIILFGLVIFEWVKLFQKKRTPMKGDFISSIVVLCTLLFCSFVYAIRFFVENQLVTTEKILNVSFAIIVFVVDLIIKYSLYKRARENETVEENTTE